MFEEAGKAKAVRQTVKIIILAVLAYAALC